MIRKALEKDIDPVAGIYEAILDNEEAGKSCIGWARGVYPTRRTAADAVRKGTLFVCEEEGRIVAAAKIDQNQVPEYADCQWEYEAPDCEVMVLHTLVVDPACPHRGHGRAFVRFYEQYALSNGCRYLRMDTNAKNAVARGMYEKLGYREQGIVPCVFNGIQGVQLVCLEKKLEIF
ncbi:MAG: GNAT family N-acetyltransferase [Clostridiales bacterium]|nr:GNAT family N-acetyltransferase [Clostridiales bacterium]